MKHLIVIFLSVMAVSGCNSIALDPIAYIDPMIGTGFHGHTYPGATTPFGMVQLSPDTRTEGWDACSGYHYSDSTILGFSHTHLSGTGCADLADVLFYPTAEKNIPEGEFFSRPPHAFSHADEHASAGYYSVFLKEAGIKAELTAAPHTGVHRYVFSGDGARRIIIDMRHVVRDDEVMDMCSLVQVGDNEISGMRRTHGWVVDHYVHFSASFSENFADIDIIDGKQAVLTFPDSADTLTVAVGLSSVSEENAALNRIAEVPELDFDRVRKQAEQLWRDSLDDVVVEGGTDAQMTNFYTAQYHTKLAPNIMNDVNGQYRRHDDTIATVPEGRKYYSTFSLWDTFRAWHPLQTLVDTGFVSDMVFSLLDMYDHSGELPIWPLASGETGTMIGYHAVSVIADAYMKGIGGFDADHALEAMVRSSEINRKGADMYGEYGYIPSNFRRESISLTLEYSYDDWAIARMAEKMGMKDIADKYYARAASYVNVFDGCTRFFRGKNIDGSWVEPFEPFSTGRDYTEATPWHYRFFAPHDVNGLEQLFGGREAFIAALDELFTVESDKMQLDVSDVTGLMGQYAHGNEPSHHMAYLYSYAGQPWKTQELTRKLLDEMYGATPEGIIGNEDCGQMSAWYILSSLGFYPVCPGSNEFVLTSPLFPKATVRLANGRKLAVSADMSEGCTYIKKVTFRGRDIDKNFIGYQSLMRGGELKFVLSDIPDTSRGTKAEDLPYSMTKGQVVSVPYTTSRINLFEGELSLGLGTATDGARIYYTMDGSEPDMSSALYTGPVSLDSSAVVKVKAFKDGYQPSPVLTLDARKADYRKPSHKPVSANGVRFTYHEGVFANVSQVETSVMTSSGKMSVPDISKAPQKDHFAYIFTGYINVPSKGVWEFMTKSDDGSVLYIGNERVVDNDGSHAAVAATGRIALDKGLHPFRLVYFEDYEGEELAWGWKAPGAGTFSNIPANNLYY